jgi:hypothetical protein
MADHPFVKPVIGILQGERPNAVQHQLRDRRQIVDRPFRQPSGNVRYLRIPAVHRAAFERPPAQARD